MIEKTKETPIAITIQGKVIEQVEQFVYIGGPISSAFGMMNTLNKIWRSKELTKITGYTKVIIYGTMIQLIFHIRIGMFHSAEAR